MKRKEQKLLIEVSAVCLLHSLYCHIRNAGVDSFNMLFA